MAKKIISEGIVSKIAQLIFKGYGPKLHRAAKGDKELQKAISDVDTSLKKIDALLKKKGY